MTSGEVQILRVEFDHIRTSLRDMREEIADMRSAISDIRAAQARVAGILATACALSGGAGVAIAKLFT